MKSAVTFGLLNLVVLTGFAQQNFEASIAGADRRTLVESSIDIPDWHEKSFWSLYEKYLANHEQVASLTYRALDDLAKTDKSVGDQEAFDHAEKMIAYRYDELRVRTEYFTEIGTAFNGVIALQFLQTEALLDMMESSGIYEGTSWRNFRFHPKAMTAAQFRSAKYNTIASALSLTPEQAEIFFKVYTRYELECDNLLGEDYSIYELYAGDPADFTPGLSKRLGHNLLQVMKREMNLKEKYFLEMNSTVGSSLACRFLAWEDYYSLVSKMYVWAEGQ